MSGKLLQQLFKKVYGKPSWLVRRRFGPSILLEFGKPKLEVSKNVFPPTKKGRKFPKRMVKVYGHWHLTTFCSDWEANKAVQERRRVFFNVGFILPKRSRVFIEVRWKLFLRQ